MDQPQLVIAGKDKNEQTAAIVVLVEIMQKK
jgi:hypothetical protein